MCRKGARSEHGKSQGSWETSLERDGGPVCTVCIECRIHFFLHHPIARSASTHSFMTVAQSLMVSHAASRRHCQVMRLDQRRHQVDHARCDGHSRGRVHVLQAPQGALKSWTWLKAEKGTLHIIAVSTTPIPAANNSHGSISLVIPALEIGLTAAFRIAIKPQGPRKGSSDCNAPTPPRLQGGSSSRGRGSKPRWLQADTRSMRDISMSLFCSVEKCRSACNRAVIHCCLHSRSTSAFVRPAPRRRGGGLGGGGTCGVPCEGVGCDEGGCESGCGKGADRS